VVSPYRESASAPLDEPFVLVTWNANVGRGDLATLVADLRQGRLITDHVSQFAVLIQEGRRAGAVVPPLPANADVPKRLGGDSGFEIASIARTLGLHVVYAPAMRNGSGFEDRGNAILSTLPLDDVTVIELPIERQRRIALAATAHAVTADGAPWTLRLVSVHLETRAGALRQGPASARKRQAEFLVQALGVSSAPTIVAGDFNTSWGDDEPAVKTLRSAYPDAPPVRGTTWGMSVIGAKLDHVFARLPRAAVTVTRVRSRYGSDHSPLIAVVRE
jgi:endonuclease/exonuclease/phosphatase family metal-dependent hydrolase